MDMGKDMNKDIKKDLDRARKHTMHPSAEPTGFPEIKGYDFDQDVDQGVNFHKLLDSFETTGYQASELAKAISIINAMRREHCTIYLGYTSNMVSSGLREVFRFLAKHKMVDVIVTTAGGIEEDFIKCLGPFLLGEFTMPGRELREAGINRIGNILVPNNRYCRFEDFLTPILEKVYDNQQKKVSEDQQIKVCEDQQKKGCGDQQNNKQYTGGNEGSIPERNAESITECNAESITECNAESIPKSNGGSSTGIFISGSEFIATVAKEINDERSIYYWAQKNNIPVFCPALTDGSIGDMIYFFSFKHPGFRLDIAEDLRRLNDITLEAKKTGVIILGAGVVKHHILNSNMLRNGADYAVYINTSQEFDGSDAGARPDEAVSWGKLLPEDAQADPLSDSNILSGSNIKSNNQIRSNIQVQSNTQLKLAPKSPRMVKVFGDATILFPLIVARTFAEKSKLTESDAERIGHKIKAAVAKRFSP